MRLYSRLHKPIHIKGVHWKAVCIGAVVYDTLYVPWIGYPDSIWIEEVAELFKQGDTGPSEFGTAIYSWGDAIKQNMVPTVQYWVCQGDEWR